MIKNYKFIFIYEKKKSEIKLDRKIIKLRYLILK